ncbi:MAG: minor capsid protein [Bacteroidetes bacterium]|nr:minor capsid protein [Bacteroidota bacterium]
MLLKDYYGSDDCCPSVEGSIKLANGSDPFNEDFIKKVFKGELKDGQIHEGYYFDVAKKLSEALAQGLNISTFSIDSPQLKMYEKLKENIFAFSAAKSLTALQEYKKALTDENGNFVSYGQFRQKVTEVDEWFNDVHLQTEYKSARAMSQMADKWERFQKYSHLEYRTVGDSKVRDAHAKLDRLVLETSDPMWDKIWPPNDWNCRCTVVPAQGASVEGRERADTFSNSKEMKPYFKRNVGKEQTVFKGDHPYFARLSNEIKKGNLHQFMAEENYNMPSVEKIYEKGKRPDMKKAGTKEEAFSQWEKSSKKVKTVDGIEWDLSNQWKHVVQEHATENRWKYINNVKDVLENTDEVWSAREIAPNGKERVFKRYVKYYNEKPVIFSYDVDEPDKWTIYDAEVDETGKYTKLRNNIRRGVLIKR